MRGGFPLCPRVACPGKRRKKESREAMRAREREKDGVRESEVN